ncbi:MAG TPA: hypothetical protein VFM70_00840 [Salinimicrobium sp.]|nr:hypothetical protein [Salinimicrobium sp.]
MNPLNKSTAWLEIFVLMLGAFLIGYFFARYYYRKKYINDLEDCIAENQRLKFEETEILLEEDHQSGIKAIKTRDRTGKPIQNQEDLEEALPLKKSKNPEFSLANIGTADPEKRDDLTKITGIGPFIEEKLNELGIYTFNQISKLSEEDMEALNNQIEYLPNQIQEEEWVEQAETLKKPKKNNKS